MDISGYLTFCHFIPPSGHGSFPDYEPRVPALFPGNNHLVDSITRKDQANWSMTIRTVE